MRVPMLFAVLVVGLLAGWAVPRAAGQLTLTGQTFGTTRWNVTILDPPVSPAAGEIEALIVAQLDDVNRRMSTYRAESEVSRFNAWNSRDWFEVSPATAAVVARSLELHRATEGAFDITVGPLVNLWHFGPGKGEVPALPAESAIAAARAHIGSDKLEVRREPTAAIRKLDPDIQIDLSSIAEGYAVDQVVAALQQLGIRQMMVDVGGEIVVRGGKSGGTPWQIAIARPVAGEISYDHVVAVKDIALSTSGDYRNFYEVDGVRYSHAIDPQTGRPAQNRLASATVLAPDCATADAISTAVMVLGTDRGHAICQQLGLPLLTIERSATGFTERKSGAMTVTDLRKAAGGSFWPTALAAFLVFILAMAGMALGVALSGRRIQGSCGGLANQTDGEGNPACGLCRNPAAECRERLKAQAAAASSADSSP